MKEPFKAFPCTDFLVFPVHKTVKIAQSEEGVNWVHGVAEPKKHTFTNYDSLGSRWGLVKA